MSVTTPVNITPHYPVSQMPSVITPWPGIINLPYPGVISDDPNISGTPIPSPLHPTPPSSLVGMGNSRTPGNTPIQPFTRQALNADTAGFSKPDGFQNFQDRQNRQMQAKRMLAAQPKFGFLPDCGIISIPAAMLFFCCCCPALLLGGLIAGGLAMAFRRD